MITILFCIKSTSDKWRHYKGTEDRIGSRWSKAWIRACTNHLPSVKKSFSSYLPNSKRSDSSDGAVIEMGHHGRNQDSDRGVLVGYCWGGFRDDEWPLPDLRHCLWEVVGSAEWGSGGVSLPRPRCAMLMMTDVLQLDVLTGPKAPCH